MAKGNKTMKLKWKLLNEYAAKTLPRFEYDPDFDAVTLTFAAPHQETIVHYVDEHVALLYLPKTHEIVGLQIEAFVRSFLPQHAALRDVWSLREHIDTNEIENIGELILKVDRVKPIITKEIIKASESSLGTHAKKLEQAFESQPCYA